ncbi:DUF362 domain-containing protein [Chloroflexota bacterium]
MAKVFVARATRALEQHLQDALTYLDWERLVPSGARVFFKPNLTYPTPRAGVTTTSEFVEAVLHVFAQRTSSLVVGESDGGYKGWPAELSFQSHNLPEVCRRYGARLVNLSRQPRKSVPLGLSKGRVKLSLPALLLDDIDVFVTLPVPKMHQVTVMSAAIKNQWGCIPDNMRLVNHPYFDEMILEINRLVGTRMALADGTYFLNRSGPMFGDPVRMDLVLASDSIGALDTTLCQIMGLDPMRIRYLNVARRQGWIPPLEEIEHNDSPDSFYAQRFYLQLTLRNRIVRWAFDRPWAIKLSWNSWFADQFHKTLYAVTGSKVHEDIARFTAQSFRSDRV